MIKGTNVKPQLLCKLPKALHKPLETLSPSCPQVSIQALLPHFLIPWVAHNHWRDSSEQKNHVLVIVHILYS